MKTATTLKVKRATTCKRRPPTKEEVHLQKQEGRLFCFPLFLPPLQFTLYLLSQIKCKFVPCSGADPMSKGLGYTQQKLLLLLAGGVILGLTRSPKQYFRIVRGIRKEWKDLNSRQLHDATYSLFEAGYLKEVEHGDGTVTLMLNEKGRETALRYDLERMSIPRPERWDGKWRIVLFDIPEYKKQAREALREMLYVMNFYQYQKSVFVHPHDCRKELKFLVEHYEVAAHVRLILAESLDNELKVRRHFKLE